MINVSTFGRNLSTGNAHDIGFSNKCKVRSKQAWNEIWGFFLFFCFFFSIPLSRKLMLTFGSLHYSTVLLSVDSSASSAVTRREKKNPAKYAPDSMIILCVN